MKRNFVNFKSIESFSYFRTENCKIYEGGGSVCNSREAKTFIAKAVFVSVCIMHFRRHRSELKVAKRKHKQAKINREQFRQKQAKKLFQLNEKHFKYFM
jgi:hypothetical protein